MSIRLTSALTRGEVVISFDGAFKVAIAESAYPQGGCRFIVHYTDGSIVETDVLEVPDEVEKRLDVTRGKNLKCSA